jgi:Rhodopirellula transposase DDE domain
VKACDHDLGGQRKDLPCGLRDEETGPRSLTFGSSAQTRDFLGDALAARGQALPAPEQRAIPQLPRKMANGPESRGGRPQFLPRRGQFADQLGKPIHFLYSPPSPSKYHPSERGWGILELHWNGALLRDADTMRAWAQSMTWKGRSPIVEITHKEYLRGITLSKKAMRAVEERLERHPELPKWDILIRPATPD